MKRRYCLYRRLKLKARNRSKEKTVFCGILEKNEYPVRMPC